MKDVKNRVEELDKKLYKFDFPRGSTAIDYYSLTTPEREILRQFHETSEEERLTLEFYERHKTLCDAALVVLWNRGFDLFQTVIDAVYGLKGVEVFIFWKRFFTFLDETVWIIRRNRLEEAKIDELFGSDPNWLSEDEDAILDTDPRWKVLQDYLDRLEDEHKVEVERKRVEEEDMLRKMIRGSGKAERAEVG